MLETLDLPQPTTKVKTDNSTASQFVHDTIKSKRNKLWDVRYHWLAEKQHNGEFDVFWDHGYNNLADYHTKHHSPKHHQSVCPTYILQIFLLTNIIKNLFSLTVCPHSSSAARVC